MPDTGTEYYNYCYRCGIRVITTHETKQEGGYWCIDCRGYRK